MPFRLQDAVCCGLMTVLQKELPRYQGFPRDLYYFGPPDVSKMAVTLCHVSVSGSKNLHLVMASLWIDGY